jgi:hypothetical protein
MGLMSGHIIALFREENGRGIGTGELFKMS